MGVAWSCKGSSRLASAPSLVCLTSSAAGFEGEDEVWGAAQASAASLCLSLLLPPPPSGALDTSEPLGEDELVFAALV